MRRWWRDAIPGNRLPGDTPAVGLVARLGGGISLAGRAVQPGRHSRALHVAVADDRPSGGERLAADDAADGPLRLRRRRRSGIRCVEPAATKRPLRDRSRPAVSTMEGGNVRRDRPRVAGAGGSVGRPPATSACVSPASRPGRGRTTSIWCSGAGATAGRAASPLIDDEGRLAKARRSGPERRPGVSRTGAAGGRPAARRRRSGGVAAAQVVDLLGGMRFLDLSRWTAAIQPVHCANGCTPATTATAS